jgi:hypothetical protein
MSGFQKGDFLQSRTSLSRIYLDEVKVGEVNVAQGGVRTLYISKDTAGYTFEDFLLTKENSFPMLWQLPQIVILTVAEIFLAVSALEFSYSQVT